MVLLFSAVRAVSRRTAGPAGLSRLSDFVRHEEGRVSKYIVDPARCTSCGVCARFCPVGAIDLSRGTARIVEDLCVDCGVCAQKCPFGAIAEREEVPVATAADGGEPVSPPEPTVQAGRSGTFGYASGGRRRGGWGRGRGPRWGGNGRAGWGGNGRARGSGGGRGRNGGFRRGW